MKEILIADLIQLKKYIKITKLGELSGIPLLSKLKYNKDFSVKEVQNITDALKIILKELKKAQLTGSFFQIKEYIKLNAIAIEAGKARCFFANKAYKVLEADNKEIYQIIDNIILKINRLI